MRNFYLFLAFVAFALHTVAAQECPDADAILPCNCSTANGMILTCRQVESSEQLAAVFQEDFPTKEFRFLLIEESLPLDTLDFTTNGVSFNLLYIYGPSQLHLITDDFLAASTETLAGIQIYETQLHDNSIHWDGLADFSILSSLILDGNRLTTIPRIESQSLVAMDFQGNGISDITTGIFEGLPSLRYLDLSFNPIRELDIATIPFNDPPSQVLLFGNIITTISTAAFYDASEDNNGAYSLLVLSNNELQTLDAGTIPITSSTTEIYLNHNQIITVARNAFYFTSLPPLNSVQLFMPENQLVTIDEEAFAPIMPYLQYINLRDNLLACGCGIAWLMTDPEALAKVSADTLCINGVSIHDLDPSFFATEC